MRDIKQYFLENKIDKQTDSGIAIEKKDEQEEILRRRSKRKRVKIRISRTNYKESVCDIIESKDDTIDKTPSPFAKLKNGEKNSHLGMNETKSGESKNFLQEISATGKVNKKQVKKKSIVDLIDSFNENMEDVKNENLSNAEFKTDIDCQREESNAFLVLMNRSKPIQYKSQTLHQSLEDADNCEQLDEVKEVKTKRKEKIIALADKKGYSKRKLAEAEEGKRIEKNIENRIKFYKGDVKSENDNALAIKNNKQPSGNLLDYFSRSSLDLADKNINCASTFLVKADVHRSETSCIESILKPIPNKIYSNKRCLKLDRALSDIDHIDIIESENLVSSQAVKQDDQSRVKPRWSLRIKLHSSEEDEKCLNNTSSDEGIFSPRSKSKFNTRQLNKSQTNTEDNTLKNHNVSIKKKLQNEEKRNTVNDQRNNDISNIVNNTIINDNNQHSDRYMKDINEIDKKNLQKDVNGAIDTMITINDNFECEIVNDFKRKPNEKLAPLFTKRRKTNPAIAQARRLFLQSDMTDIENKNTNRKINRNNISVLPFPVISHITQLQNKSVLTKIKYNFSLKVDKKYLPFIDIYNYKYIINYEQSRKSEEINNEPMKGNPDQIMLEIGKRCPDAQEIWKTISKIKSESEKKSRTRTKKIKSLEKKGKLTDKLESNNNETNQSHDCAWTYKYRPMRACHIVGNEEAARKLRDWLNGWRTSLTKEDINSSDEFYSSDCSSSCNNENNQIAVLLGPHGSGKSASIYAIAEELGYSVLEVNASSRRTGKLILKELVEATKSHRIKKNKHKSPFERVTKEDETSKISQNSLILLEDIDLIFEEDEGFISAVYQLASNTKRPIALTCRNTCPHLNKMAPQQIKIYFQEMKGNRVSVLLELIALAETGYRLPHNFLMKLLQAGDLRKALLQLQYLLLSGPPILSEQSIITKPLLWQDMQRYLYKPMIKLSRKHKTRKDTDPEKADKITKNSNTADILDKLANNLNGLALVSSLIDIEDMTLNILERNEQPNLSLVEHTSLYSTSHHLKTDIADFISNRILYQDFDKNNMIQNQNNIILKKQLYQGVDMALSHVTSTCLDQRIMVVDYLPAIRTICRAEESRSTANYKRGNRFFHYLHGLKVPAVSMKPNILAAACKMLQERVDKKTA